MAKNLPQMQVIRVLRSDVLLDQGINSRSHIDPATDGEVKRLSDSIREKGLLQPAVLLPMKQAGDKFAKRKESYLLVVGFRRQMALDLLQVEEIGYSIAPSSWTLADAMTANLTENLARKDLTPYETAVMCATMKETQGLTGDQIAKAVRAQDPDPEGPQTLSEIHVNNMIRAVRELHKKILAAWASNHPAASMRKLLKLSAEKDKNVQLAEWEKHVAELEGKGGKKTRKPRDPNEVKRPSADDLLLVAEVIKADKEKDAEWKKGALAALMWAATGEKEIPGFKLDAIKQERAAKIAEEKAAEKAAAEKAEKEKAEAAAKKGGAAGKGAGATGTASA